MAELKINIKVSPFILKYKDSQEKSKSKAMSKLEFTTEPAKSEAIGADEIINYMFFNIPVSGKTIAQMVDPCFVRLEKEIHDAQCTGFVVGQKKNTLFQNLSTIKTLLMTKLTQKFKNQYSKITIDVSQ